MSCGEFALNVFALQFIHTELTGFDVRGFRSVIASRSNFSAAIRKDVTIEQVAQIHGKGFAGLEPAAGLRQGEFVDE